LIRLLNPKIRGWGNYFRHVVSKAIFYYVDYQIIGAIRRWIKRRHPRKSEKWIKKAYFRSQNLRNWIFHAKVKSDKNNTSNLDLFSIIDIPIRRHIQIIGGATPYDPTFKEYFDKREKKKFR